MAKKEHLEILESGKEKWNTWINKVYPIRVRPMALKNSTEAIAATLALIPDLSNSKLSGKNLNGYDFYSTNLSGADLSKTNLKSCNFRRANLEGTNLSNSDLSESNFTKTSLIKANLDNTICIETDFTESNLSMVSMFRTKLENAKLVGCRLMYTQMIETNLKFCDISSCNIYGISAWDINLEGAIQEGLIITKPGKNIISVDNLEVGQFIYLLISNKKIRDIINTVAKKAVLILGRFTNKRKIILDAIAEELRKKDLLPIMFDFQKSEGQDIIETIIILAGMSKFIIADVTEARVISDELRSFVPNFAIPVVPLFQPSQDEPKPYASLYTLYKKYSWVFEPVEYEDKEQLIEILPYKIIKPAEAMRLELFKNK